MSPVFFRRFGLAVAAGSQPTAAHKGVALSLGIVVIAATITGGSSWPLACVAWATDFRPAENAVREFRSVRYENIYTKVPTTGRLVSIKITDNGTIYYICREKSGYAIYHLEVRPIENFRDKIQQELKEKSRNWDRNNPDDLLFTKDQYDRELKRRIDKYSDAVWVRNEIVIESLREPRSGR